jgi:hypothetical protein
MRLRQRRKLHGDGNRDRQHDVDDDHHDHLDDLDDDRRRRHDDDVEHDYLARRRVKSAWDLSLFFSRR